MANLRQRSAHSKDNDNEAKADGNGQFIDLASLSSQSNQPPPMYRAIRFFFKICLHSFYGNVEVEGNENIAPDNYPAILGMLLYSRTRVAPWAEPTVICEKRDRDMSANYG